MLIQLSAAASTVSIGWLFSLYPINLTEKAKKVKAYSLPPYLPLPSLSHFIVTSPLPLLTVTTVKHYCFSVSLSLSKTSPLLFLTTGRHYYYSPLSLFLFLSLSLSLSFHCNITPPPTYPYNSETLLLLSLSHFIVTSHLPFISLKTVKQY